jgi:hypothetical protein
MGEELVYLGCQQEIVEGGVNMDSRGGGRKSRGGVYGDGFEGPATAFGKSPFMRAFEERSKLGNNDARRKLKRVDHCLVSIVQK